MPEYIVRDGVNYRIVHDHLGSPRLVVNTVTGEIVKQREYDEYGRIIAETGTFDIPFGFAGGLYDADTKLIRFGARDYDPEAGRWTSKDPIKFDGGATNLFEYLVDDPINWLDPIGLFKAHGKWCGPDWTGGLKEQYTKNHKDMYEEPISALDTCCMLHDICYYHCRKNYPCDPDARKYCMKEKCNNDLSACAAGAGRGSVRILVVITMDFIHRPGPGPNADPDGDPNVCCK
ncbi:MAG TPA: RHS repeat-associated core domain-containing protein [bacterium]|nr:RHS repeat-associated core domain-containing protein [bacterium]